MASGFLSPAIGTNPKPINNLKGIGIMRTDVYQSESKPEPMLITANQAAQLLNISPRYVYTLTKKGRLRAKRIGRKKLYRVSDIQRFIDEDEAA
jgi:excisionase family DNA binding protein